MKKLVGSKVLGWWCMWPENLTATRCFNTREDAINYFPSKMPLGERWVFQVGFGPILADEQHRLFHWGHIEKLSEFQQREIRLKQLEEELDGKNKQEDDDLD